MPRPHGARQTPDMSSPRVALSAFLPLACWLAVVAPLTVWAWSLGTIAAIAFAVATSILWATGARAAALWVRSVQQPRPSDAPHHDPAPLRVALLFCVADDFDAAAVAVSMRQDVDVDTVILDDSRDPRSRSDIDRFARESGCRVVRRSDRTGFKAGNLNHGLRVLRGSYDAYVVCDSDVVLPPGFVRVCAAELADPTVAVAQAAPVAAPGRTAFARYFGPLLATHLAVTRRGRAGHGVTAFLGRGALLRAAALDDVGGVPEVVAEDLALTVALRRRGWRLVDADIAFTEDFPVDYRAFRTQLRKTAEGAVEFLRRPAVRGLPVREAIDVVGETALVPGAALAGATSIVSGAALAAGGTVPPLWALVLSALSGLMPLLPEAVRRARSRRLAAGVTFAIAAGALYASTMFVVVAAVVGGLLGRRAVFRVTPKRAGSLGVRQRIDLFRAELLVVPLLAGGAVVASGSVCAAGGVAWPLALAVAFAVPVVVPDTPARRHVVSREGDAIGHLAA